MSKDLKLALEVALATSGFGKLSESVTEIKKAGIEVNDLESEIDQLANAFKQISRDQALIKNFKRLEEQLREVNGELAELGEKNELVRKGQGSNYTQQQQKLNRLKQEQKSLNKELDETVEVMNAAGIATDNLSANEEKLAWHAQKASRALDKLTKEAEELKAIGDARIRLGIVDQDKINKELAETTKAYNLLKNSGTLSSTELANANQLHAKKLMELEQQLKGLKPTIADVRGELTKFAGAGAAFTLIAREALQFETAMVGVKKVVDGTPEQMEQLGQTIKDLAYELGMTAEETANIAAMGGQLGVAFDDLPKFTRLAGEMSVAFGMTAEEAGNAAAKMANVWGLPLEEVRELGDAINTLGNSTAAKEAEITAAMLRIGGNAKQFGLAAEEAAALADAMIALGKPPEVAATAINALLLKLQTAETLGSKAKDALRDIGFSAYEMATNIQQNPQKAITNFVDKLGEMDKQARAVALAELFGSEYVDDISLLVAGSESLAAAFDLVGDKAKNSGALNKEFAAQMDNADAKVEQAKTAVSNLSKTLGESLLPIISTAAKGIGGTANALSQLAETYPIVTQLAVSLAALKLGIVAANSASKMIALSSNTMSTSFATTATTATTATIATRSYAAALGFLNRALNVIKANPIGLGLTALVFAFEALMPVTEKYEKSLKTATDALTELQEKTEKGIELNVSNYEETLRSVTDAIVELEYKLVYLQQTAKEDDFVDFLADSLPLWDSNSEKVEKLSEQLNDLKVHEEQLKVARDKALDAKRITTWVQEQNKLQQQASDAAKGISNESREALDVVTALGKASQEEVRGSLDTVKQALASITDEAGLEEFRAQIYSLHYTSKIPATIRAELLQQADKHLGHLKSTAQEIETIQSNSNIRSYEQLKALSQAWSVLGEDVKNTLGIMSESDEKIISALNNIVSDANLSADEITKAFSSALSKVDTAEGVQAIQTTFYQIEKSGRLSAKELTGIYDALANAMTSAMSNSKEETKKSLEQLGLSAAELSTGITDSEQKIIVGVESIVSHINNVSSSSHHAGEMLERYFVSASSKIKTPEGLEAFRKKFTEIADAAGFSAEKIKEMTDSVSPAFAKLGVDVDAVMTGISDSAETAMSNFVSAIEAAQQSGTNSMKLTQAAIDAVLKTLNSNEEFNAFDKSLEKLGLRSQATAAQIEKINAGKTKSANDSAEATKKSTEATEKQSIATEKQSESTKKLAETTKAATTAEKENSEAKRESVVRSKQLYDTNNLNEQQLKSMLQLSQKLKQGGDLLHSAGFNVDYRKKLQDTADAYRQINAVVDDMNDSISDGSINLSDLELAFSRAAGSAHELDDATTEHIRAEIDRAKKAIKELTATAKSEVQDLEAELAGIKGDDSARRDLEQKRKLAAIEDKLAAARKRNNTEEIAAYEKSLDLQRQIFTEKEKEIKKAAEQRKQSGREKANESKNKEKNAKTNRRTVIDHNKVTKEFNESFTKSISTQDLSNLVQSLGRSAGRELINQMKDEANRKA